MVLVLGPNGKLGLKNGKLAIKGAAGTDCCCDLPCSCLRLVPLTLTATVTWGGCDCATEDVIFLNWDGVGHWVGEGPVGDCGSTLKLKFRCVASGSVDVTGHLTNDACNDGPDERDHVSLICNPLDALFDIFAPERFFLCCPDITSLTVRVTE